MKFIVTLERDKAFSRGHCLGRLTKEAGYCS